MKIPQFLAAVALSLVLGSLHAFSVLLAPLEISLSLSRGTVSLAYSLAILSLTAGVAFSPLIFRFVDSMRCAVVLGFVAAAGLLVAAFSRSGIGLIAGYGILFGFCNGVGYALFLAEAARAVPQREGLAIGIITAVYSIGTMVFSLVFDAVTSNGAPQRAFTLLAFCVATAGIAAAFGFTRGHEKRAICDAPADKNDAWITIQLWLIYYCGASSSLMVIGHAAGVARDAGVVAIAWAPVVVAFGNIIGSLTGGRLSDLCSPHRGLMAAGIIGTGALAALLLWPSLTLLWLVVLGFAYGALISLIPALLNREFGMAKGSLLFSRIFTAWGAAGLSAPWVAGILFDNAGSYRLALAIALGLVFCGIVLALLLPLKMAVQSES